MPAPKDPQRYEEWRRNLAERNRQRMSDPLHRQRLVEANKGRRSSPETRAKMSASHKLRHAKAGGDALSPEARKRVTEASKGRKQSSETRAKLSSKLKGRTAPNRGKSMSEEQKAKLSDANKGRKHTEEAKRKIGEAARGPRPELRGRPAHNKGKTMSEEQKAKLSAAKRGIPHSTEARAKIADAHRGRKRSPETCEKIGAIHRGKFVSAETRAKLSDANKGKPGFFKGKRHTPESREKMRQATNAQWEQWTEEQRAAKIEVLREATRDITHSKIEDYYAYQLDIQGIVYERQKRIGWYRVDFYLPGENKVIEVQGCYWHCCESCGFANAHEGKREADEKRYEYLHRKGYALEIVWEHDLPRRRS